MMIERTKELVDQILIDLAAMNVGPGTATPLKTLWLRACRQGAVEATEFNEALQWAAETGGFMTLASGIAGQGSVKLTEEGYLRSRELAKT